MSTHVQASVLGWPQRPALGPRLGIIAVVLTLETLVLSFLIQGTPVTAASGVAAVIHDVQHFAFRFAIAYAVVCVLLFSLGREGSLASIGAQGATAPFRATWAVAHGLVMLPFAWLSTQLYGADSAVPFLALAVAWHGCALAAAVSLFAALAPLSVWAHAFGKHRRVMLYSIAPALGTVAAIQASQALWHPAARVTFFLTSGLLRPLLPAIWTDLGTLTLGTSRFAVTIADQCSGLEGMGLMLIFCISWLWFFRREYFFPRAFLIIPAALLLVFLLNAVRIAGLVLIGDAGYPRVAVVGFHSQAGWIAFNTAAFMVALVARRSTWVNRTAYARAAGIVAPVATENPTAPFLMPLLVILAAGMLSHAVSSGFEVLYPVRLIAAAIALWAYRRHYRGLGWSFSWRGIAAGLALCALWIGVDHGSGSGTQMPAALAAMSASGRGTWILGRALAAIVTVPLAEELAYRGFLMRRIAAAEFETLSFRAVPWPALVGSSLVFGITHGDLWLPGIVAGLTFGCLAIRAGKIGEAVAAHAAANAGIAAYVLLFDQWQLW